MEIPTLSDMSDLIAAETVRMHELPFIVSATPHLYIAVNVHGSDTRVIRCFVEAPTHRAWLPPCVCS